jgi:hypothetical protein
LRDLLGCCGYSDAEETRFAMKYSFLYIVRGLFRIKPPMNWVGPPLTYCRVCRFQYAGDIADHSPEDCARAIESKASPCGACAHGRHYHSDDLTMCVAMIAGNNRTGELPGFCRCKGYTVENG